MHDPRRKLCEVQETL
uniref:Uncharacterized protein n=1 Tax=Arundo donax TaxID=35708 RepID=A0A0A9BXL1_ARUDO